MIAVPVELDTGGIAARLGLAVLLGAVVGLNRDIHHKPAGLRTHAIVALGAAMVTLTGVLLSAGTADATAVTRIVQGIVTGVGFIGGGVILRRTDPMGVHGLTTAATIWVVAALGIACGAGQSALALIAFGLMLAVLVIGGPIERRVHRWLAVDSDKDSPASHSDVT